MSGLLSSKRIDQFDPITSLAGTEYLLLQNADTFAYERTSLNDVANNFSENLLPDATTLKKGKLQLASDLGGTAALPKVRASNRILIGPYGYNRPVDYVCASATGNQVEVGAAITAAATLSVMSGVGVEIEMLAGNYSFASTITLPALSNITIRGHGPATVVKMTTNNYPFQNGTGNITDLHFRDITFYGNNRTSGITSAIFLYGDNDPEAPVGSPTITNITLDNINVRNTTSLPIKLFGCKGKIRVTNCEFYQCLDAGFIFDDEVIFIGNHSYGSGDNGFSISRGCRKIICVGNTVENPTLYGMWFAGFANDNAPTDLVVTGNTVINSRYSCINLSGAPQRGVISNNYLYQGYTRPSGQNPDGISIGPGGGGTNAEYLNVTGNTILACARAGITFYGCDQISITNNLIGDCGSQYYNDGVTEILSSATDSNAGILTTHIGTMTNCYVGENTIYDTRATPLCNWAVWKQNTTGVTYGQNYSSGMRNTVNNLSYTLISNSGSPVAMSVGGGDSDVDYQMNMRGNGQTQIRGTGNDLNLNNTSSSSSAASSLQFSAGAVTARHAYISATRKDAASSSLIALRPLSNGSIMGADTTAALYYQGGASTSKGFFGWNGGMVASRKTVTNTAYSVLTQDYTVAYISTLTASRAVTLPSSPLVGQTHIIKDETGLATTYNLVISPASGTIDGASSVSVSTNYGSVTLQYDGTNWGVIGRS